MLHGVRLASSRPSLQGNREYFRPERSFREQPWKRNRKWA